MRSSAAELSQNEERLREYQRQQERLKAMTVNADKIKSVSADVMIENLLKQNFAKPVNKSVENKINSKLGLPNWLESDSPDVPGLYKHLWNLVKTATNYADTQKVSQLLLTSGLATEVLGYIWNMSNNEVPGQLNKQEFFIVLALVALAQSGYSFNNLSVLNFVPVAPIPALQTIVIENYGQSPTAMSNTFTSEVPQARPLNDEPPKVAGFNVPTITDYSFFNTSTPTTLNKSLRDSSEVKPVKKSSKLGSSKEFYSFDSARDFSKKSNFPFIGSSPTAELEEDDDFSEFHSVTVSATEPPSEITVKKEDPKPPAQVDEFTDFQCADIGGDPLGTLVLGQKKEIPKIHLPKNLTGKISNLRTNILKISPESEKKLKVLKQSESLSSLPESKISSNNVVSTMPSISVLGGSRDIGMRLAHHSLGSKAEKVRHQRHHKHKQPAPVDDMNFSSKFGSIDELFPKCFQKSSSGSKTFVLKETKIPNMDMPEPEAPVPDCDPSAYPYQSSKNTRKIEIPMLGTFNETTLPTQTENTVPCKQPAFELFSLEEDKYSALREVELEMKLKNTESDNKERNDDVNALNSGDDFGEFLSADIPPSAPVEDADLWGEWKDNPEPEPVVENTSDTQKPLEDFSFLTTEKNSNPIKEKDTLEDMSITLNVDLLKLNEEDYVKTLNPRLEFETEITNTGLKTKSPSLPGMISLDVKADKVEENSRNLDDFMMLDGLLSLNTNENNFPNTPTLQTTMLNDKPGTNEDFGIFFTTDLAPAPPEINPEDVLPSLDLKVLSGESNANGIRRKCLTACLNLMQQALDIFSNVTSPSVLQEIFSTEEAVNYLNNLNIISHISRRTSFNCCELSGIQEEIERIWQKLVNFCDEYNIRLKKDLDSDASIGVQCYVCLGFIGNDIIEQGINSYHPSCANLWINCIDSELPCPI